MFFFVQVFQVQRLWRKTCEIFAPWSRLSKDCCTCDQWHHHQVTFWTWQKRNIFCNDSIMCIHIHRYTFSDWNNDGNLPKFDISSMKGFNFQLFDLTPILATKTKPQSTWLWDDLCFLSFPKRKIWKNWCGWIMAASPKKGKKKQQQKRGGTSVSLFTWSSSCAMRRCASKSRWQVSEKTCIENCCKWTKQNRKACSKILDGRFVTSKNPGVPPAFCRESFRNATESKRCCTYQHLLVALRGEYHKQCLVELK